MSSVDPVVDPSRARARVVVSRRVDVDVRRVPFKQKKEFQSSRIGLFRVLDTVRMCNVWYHKNYEN